ncbi:MupG family TIM beta-alpha barrel fold protein [Rossellomorea oryzaecorticis]|uniref:MupG family TIM beta-alpha barrel fold protein n=1 Tax=Rossellomorea oryzaecorticis TaxID=1396505 RepID=A0ABU9KBE0_9BACI
MLGISVYLKEENRDRNAEWIRKSSSFGFQSIFTSLHIPEDNPDTYKELLQELGGQARTYNMELLADVSPRSLEHLGLDWDSLPQLLDWGLAGIRVDYGFTEDEIVSLSKLMKTGINASTVSGSELDSWIEKGLNVENVEAWHNFYPRPETGLDLDFLNERNTMLKSKGITTMAFIPGNETLRGPVFEGLPTLEQHRYVSPALAAAQLKFSGNTDKILIGDPSATDETLYELSSIDKEIIPLTIDLLDGADHSALLTGVHTNRMDPARDVIRSVESRSYAEFGKIIEPSNQVQRTVGMITVDNELYGRYSGEMQIVKRELPKDEKVNVIAKVVNEDLPLIHEIKAGGKFQLLVRDTI